MSSATGPQALSDLLTREPRLRALQSHDRSSDEPVPELPPLPPALAAHCRLVRESDHLLLLARNSSVAQMLRFHGPRLARAAGLPDYRVRVDPTALGEQAPRPGPVGPVPSLPANAGPTLRHLAQTLDHAPLREALERLAKLAGS